MGGTKTAVAAADHVTCGTPIATFICDSNDITQVQETLLSWPVLSVLLPSSEIYKKRPRFEPACVSFLGFNNAFNKLPKSFSVSLLNSHPFTGVVKKQWGQELEGFFQTLA